MSIPSEIGNTAIAGKNNSYLKAPGQPGREGKCGAGAWYKGTVSGRGVLNPESGPVVCLSWVSVYGQEHWCLKDPAEPVPVALLDRHGPGGAAKPES